MDASVRSPRRVVGPVAVTVQPAGARAVTSTRLIVPAPRLVTVEVRIPPPGPGTRVANSAPTGTDGGTSSGCDNGRTRSTTVPCAGTAAEIVDLAWRTALDHTSNSR